MSAISVENVSKAWGDTKAVDGIDFEASEGEFTVLLGPSGCGKSTTLRLIAGLESVTSGRIVIGGRDVTGAPPAGRDLAFHVVRLKDQAIEIADQVRRIGDTRVFVDRLHFYR